jgi:hypothetical protein
MGWFKKDPPKKPSREELLKQAAANAKAAREAIGEDTLNRIAEAMQKKQQSSLEQAKERVRQIDKDRVTDHIRSLLDEK